MQPAELIYLACPFRHADPMIQQKRCAAAHYVAAQLFKQNRHVFSPLTHNELLIHLAQDVAKEEWLAFDLAILAICKRLFVLQLEGWDISKGVQIEIDFAHNRGIPVEMIAPPPETEFQFLLHRQHGFFFRPLA